MSKDQGHFFPWHCTSNWKVEHAHIESDVTGEIQRGQWNAFPLDIHGCPYDNRVLNHTRWTDEEDNMLMQYSGETIFVFRLLQSDFIHNDDNPVTFYDVAKTVKDTRGALSIERSHAFDTSLDAGFTPAQFLASSFILIEHAGYAEVLMALLKKRVRLPWMIMLSTKFFPVSSRCIDDKHITKPYKVLQLHRKLQSNADNVGQQYVTAQSQVAQWDTFPLDVYGLPCDDRQINNTRWTTDELTTLSCSRQLPIRVYCLRKDDFQENVGNVLPFYSAIKQVEDTRGDLPIPKSFLYDTNILIGFTPAHFLHCSFIQVETEAFATLLMTLLQKRLYPPWEIKGSIKHFPRWSRDHNEYTSHPYHILQLHDTTTEKSHNDDIDTENT